MPWFWNAQPTETIPTSPWEDPETLAVRYLQNGRVLLQDIALLVYHTAWAVFCRIHETFSVPHSENQRYWKFYTHHFLLKMGNDLLTVRSAFDRLQRGTPGHALDWDSLRGRILRVGHYWFG